MRRLRGRKPVEERREADVLSRETHMLLIRDGKLDTRQLARPRVRGDERREGRGIGGDRRRKRAQALGFIGIERPPRPSGATTRISGRALWRFDDKNLA